MNAGNTSGGGVALAGAWPRALQQPTSRGQNAAELKPVRSSVVLDSLLFCVFAAKQQQLNSRYEKNKLLLKVANRQTSSIRS